MSRIEEIKARLKAGYMADHVNFSEDDAVADLRYLLDTLRQVTQERDALNAEADELLRWKNHFQNQAARYEDMARTVKAWQEAYRHRQNNYPSGTKPYLAAESALLALQTETHDGK